MGPFGGWGATSPNREPLASVVLHVEDSTESRCGLFACGANLSRLVTVVDSGSVSGIFRGKLWATRRARDEGQLVRDRLLAWIAATAQIHRDLRFLKVRVDPRK